MRSRADLGQRVAGREARGRVRGRGAVGLEVNLTAAVRERGPEVAGRSRLLAEKPLEARHAYL